MTKTILAAILALGASTASGAGLYKCTDPATGKATYSQFQCASDAAPIELDMTRPTPAQIQQAQENEARAVATVNALAVARQQARAEHAQRARIAALQAARDAKVRTNERRASRANNNLAGAVYRGAIAEESAMQVERYNADIEAERRQLERIRGE